MNTGSVLWYHPEKGYGFIRDDNGGDVFIHETALQSLGLYRLYVDQRLSYDIAQTPHGMLAEKVSLMPE